MHTYDIILYRKGGEDMKRRKQKNRHALDARAATEIIKLLAAIITLLTAFLKYILLHEE